jgi:hypothetical protein
MKRYKLMILFVAASLVIVSCKKEDVAEKKSGSIEFLSLEAASDSLDKGSTTRILANANGKSIEYHWSATAGDIFGNGAEIIYAASNCCLSQNTITCTIKDNKGNKVSKSLVIHVRQ